MKKVDTTIIGMKYKTNGKFWPISENHKRLKSVFLSCATS